MDDPAALGTSSTDKIQALPSEVTSSTTPVSAKTTNYEVDSRFRMASESSEIPSPSRSIALKVGSRSLSSSNGRILRSSSLENNDSNDFPQNDHLHLKSNGSKPNHQHLNPLDITATHTSIIPTIQSSSSMTVTSSSFFIMITGYIESVQYSSSSLHEHLYCRYTFSYGPDWEVVHGVSMGLSQIGRQGIFIGRKSENRCSTTVFNFPLDVSFQSTNPFGWPRLVVSVYGFDFLGRDVPRGYASVLLPVNPGKHVRNLKTFRPVSGAKCEQIINWLIGRNPEYYDSKMVAKGEGRGITRVVSEDEMSVRVSLVVTRKNFTPFGYCSSPATFP